MDNELLELLKYRYDRAVETLEVAKELFKNGKFKDANNRSYYAAYYAMMITMIFILLPVQKVSNKWKLQKS